MSGLPRSFPWLFAAALVLLSSLFSSATALDADPLNSPSVGHALEPRNNNAVKYAAAPTCCVGCGSGPAPCCCAARDKQPVKVTVTKTGTKVKTTTLTRKTVFKTTTVTTTTTVLPNRLVARGLEPATEPVVIEVPQSPAASAESQKLKRNLFPRHLCPTCPKNVGLVPLAQGNRFCCPPRKTTTITKSVARTVTKTASASGLPVTSTRTSTSTVSVQVLSGRVFTDVNGNGQYDPGVDIPLANTNVSLVSAATKKRAACTIVQQTTTDSQGLYSMILPVGGFPPNSTLGLALEGCKVLVVINVNADGSVVEFVVPIPVTLVKTSTTQTATATQTRSSTTATRTQSSTSASATQTQTSTSASQTETVSSTSETLTTTTPPPTSSSTTAKTGTTTTVVTSTLTTATTAFPDAPKGSVPRLKPREINDAFGKPKSPGHSTVNCVSSAQDSEDVVCRVNRLYYHYTRGFFLLGDTANTQLVDRIDLVKLDSVKGLDRGFVVGIFSEPPNAKVTRIHSARTHVFSRFVPENVFHELHDCLLPLVATVDEFGSSAEISQSQDIQNVEFLAADAWQFPNWKSNIEPFYYAMLLPTGASSNQTLMKSLLHSKTKELFADSAWTDALHVWEDVVVGLRKSTVWYDYGFKQHQKPVDSSDADLANRRKAVNKASNWLSTRILREPGFAPPVKRQVLLFDRGANRKIVNSDELLGSLKAEYEPRGFEVRRVMMETHAQRELAALVKSADLIVGMHGSMLALGMLSENAAILEMFPYGVPSNNYQVYRRMCELRDGCRYAAWENHDLGKTVAPNDQTPRLLGGLSTLHKDEQQKIIQARWVEPHKCCEDPAWLYRIYSDTIVDVAKVMQLAKSLV